MKQPLLSNGNRPKDRIWFIFALVLHQTFTLELDDYQSAKEKSQCHNDIKGIMTDEAFEPYIERFREHYNRYYSEQQYDYDDVLPAYYHGFVVASNGSSGAATPHWIVVKDAARNQWDETSTPWEEVSDAVKYAWKDVTGKDND